MKKILFIIILIIVNLSIFSQNLTYNSNKTTKTTKTILIDISPWVGYSWLNGVLGVEAQFGQFGISGGWFPAKMPYSKDPVSSFNAAATFYGRNNKYLNEHGGTLGVCYYGSFGVASAGYRFESYSNSTIYNSYIQPIYIVMAGVKSYTNRFQFKLGFGYGWCSEANTFTWEVGISYAIFSNHELFDNRYSY